MATKHILAIAFCGLAAFGSASAEPVPTRCTATFEGAGGQGAFTSANIEAGTLLTLTVELGPTRAPLALAGGDVARGYSATTTEPELSYWTYMSIYEPAAEWLTPGSVKLYYSGFRLGWPVFRRGKNPVDNLELTVTQGDQSMAIDVRPDETGTLISSRAIAIDFEEMLPDRAPAVRVPSHLDWRRVSEQGHAASATLTNIETGEIVARGTAAGFEDDTYQTLLSGGLNALRDKFKAGQCE